MSHSVDRSVTLARQIVNTIYDRLKETWKLDQYEREG